MAVRPPSLRAIAAFEAAARHESFTKAADELNLTQSAISHAVRSLELRLGVDLFERLGRTVVLTDAGRGFVSRLRLSLSLISEAFEVPDRTSRTRLVIAAAPDIAERLLAPRLPAYARDHDDEEDIELRTTAGPADVVAGEVDVAIVFGRGAHPGLAQRSLSCEVLFPVQAPSLPMPKRPEDLIRLPLIHQSEYPWRVWLSQVGLADLPTPTAITTDSALAAVMLARAGAGVCLARGMMVRDDLEAGRLIRPFDGEAALDDEYSALWSPASPRLAAIRRLMDWFAGDLNDQRSIIRTAA